MVVCCTGEGGRVSFVRLDMIFFFQAGCGVQALCVIRELGDVYESQEKNPVPPNRRRAAQANGPTERKKTPSHRTAAAPPSRMTLQEEKKTPAT